MSGFDLIHTYSGDIKKLFCLHKCPHAITEVRSCGTEYVCSTCICRHPGSGIYVFYIFGYILYVCRVLAYYHLNMCVLSKNSTYIQYIF